ncbi:PpiC-type peptidyl-prolyl cis-trans isomerase [Sterolibacterium denitrificans]|uniref:peptidylprolyl isomerase n=1 Tax=Sterolibacterium denitrificans TaxID=157592 RepID=A0A7Z7MVM3_9PROT|nr:peptidylprolyl isomerase [Sterolibacterium denitrificans]SMB28079.1 PpiC-type peptidyl-prolyl cis-trans isomerase [Sterolibacterium denitrificans]
MPRFAKESFSSISPLFSALALAILLTAPIPAQAASDTAAMVNGQAIKRSRVDLIVKDVADAGRKADPQAVLDALVTNELLAQEAQRQGIDRQAGFAERMENRQKELLATQLIRDHLRRNPVTEERLKAEYEKFRAAVGEKEYSARHILLKTEAEAKEVIALLVKGADFAKLAKEKSQDAATREKGGQLAWFARNAVIPPLGQAAASLQKGLYTTLPLRSRAGWHVLKLEDVRDLQVPAYDAMKARLRQRLVAQQTRKLIEGLRSKANIEMLK